MKIFVAIPSGSSRIYTHTVLKLLELDRLCKNNNIDLDIVFENGTSIVHHARNILVSQFINCTNDDYILFIDDDIEFEPINIIEMIATNCDVISGIYPYKRYNWNKIINVARLSINDNIDRTNEIKNCGLYYTFTNPENNLEFEVKKEPVEVEGVGTGCLLIKRSVVIKMLESMKERSKYVLNDNEYYRLFDIEIENGVMVSEDFWFCRRWREIGGRVYIATWAKCAHWGHHKYG